MGIFNDDDIIKTADDYIYKHITTKIFNWVDSYTDCKVPDEINLIYENGKIIVNLTSPHVIFGVFKSFSRIPVVADNPLDHIKNLSELIGTEVYVNVMNKLTIHTYSSKNVPVPNEVNDLIIMVTNGWAEHIKQELKFERLITPPKISHDIIIDLTDVEIIPLKYGTIKDNLIKKLKKNNVDFCGNIDIIR